MGKLHGRVAIVTGASQGSGYGAAVAMAREGASLVLVSRTEKTLRTVAETLTAEGTQSLVLPADVADPATPARVVEETLARFGRIDILVNAAQSPIMRGAALVDISDTEIAELWQSGAVATLALMRAVRPHMAAAGGGSIVNFGSGAIHNPIGYGVYAGVKAAIQAIGRAAALEWGKDGIRVNMVLPFAASPAAALDFDGDADREQRFIATTPLGRIGDLVTDIGAAVAFLASDDSAYITGTTLPLDGGRNYVR